MAGGMRRGPGRPLAERATDAAGGHDRAGAPPDGVTRAAGRHCWADPPGHPGGPWPGLVVEWRRGPGGWEGRTVYCLPDPRDGGMRLVEAWLPGRCLTAVQA